MNPEDTKDLMKEVRRIRVTAAKLVDEYLAGEYRSAFRGAGIEFEEVREYSAGDDVRSIDWNVSARMGRPYVKTFREERQLTIMFLIDISGSQCFGSRSLTKDNVSARLACLLALSAVKNQDKVGLILFDEGIETYLKPRKGSTAVWRLVREVLRPGRKTGRTDLSAALRFLGRTQKKRAVVFLISDFMGTGYARELRTAAKMHDLVCCAVSDPAEIALPRAGVFTAYDPESHASVLIDTDSARVRDTLASSAREREKKMEELFCRHGIDSLKVSTASPFVGELRRLLRERRTRRKRA
ncbi:MAG: DUF58 domain-containing protein [Kiritimatiellia bacterium]